jgi:hypothetical protein
MDALEIIQPKTDVHLGRIIFRQIQLRPAHGLIEPTRVIIGERSGRPRVREESSCDGLLEEFPASSRIRSP